MVVVGKRGVLAWTKTLAGAVLAESKAIPHDSKWWNLIGYEITFPSAYTGNITFTKVVADTVNEVDQPYRVVPEAGCTKMALFDINSPIFMASDGDSITVASSAAITGKVEITLHYEADSSPGYV